MKLKALWYVPHVLKNQYLNPENLKTLQEKRLKPLVKHAYKNTKFYKEKFKKAGITPDDITRIDDLRKIPLSTKEEIKASPHQIVARGYTEENCEVHYTSGSSGSLLKVLYDLEHHAYDYAVSYRFHLGQGVRPWHKYFLICNDPVELEYGRRRSILYRRTMVPWYFSVEEKVKRARAYNPHVMGGHLSTFVAMAQHVENNGIEDLHPKTLIVGGELNLPPYRRYVEKVFRSQTYDKYGAYEAKSIAWECRHHKMHIDADSSIVEFIKDGEPVSAGERGEVVITHFWNWAMPFIRYRLGDIGIPSDELCPCGRTLPLMKVIEGRLDDFIVLPSGRIIPPAIIVPLFLATTEIGQFKIIQNKRDLLEVYVVPKKEYTVEVEQDLVRRVETALGEPVHITIEKADQIEQKARGKYRAVISNIRTPLSSV
jgi:phenylacetate-CoA ligase